MKINENEEGFNGVAQMATYDHPLSVLARKRALAEDSDQEDNYFTGIAKIAAKYENSPEMQIYEDGSLYLKISNKIALGAFLDTVEDAYGEIIEDIDIWTMGEETDESDSEDEGIDIDLIDDSAYFGVDIYIKEEYAIYDAEYNGYMEEDEVVSESENSLRYDESTLYEDYDTISEVKRKWKVNSRGMRRIKMKCKPGFKWNGKACVKISGVELSTKRRATRKMLRTKKAQGDGLKRRVKRKTAKAKRFRKSFGLK